MSKKTFPVGARVLVDGRDREQRHIEEAIAEIRDVCVVQGMRLIAAMTDRELVDRIEANGVELRAAEERGEAEVCHERARNIAAMTIEYMARGLA